MLELVDHRQTEVYGDRLANDTEFVISGEVIVDKQFLLPDEFVSDSIWLSLHHPDIGIVMDRPVRSIAEALAVLRTELYNAGIWHYWSIDIYRTVAKNHRYITTSMSISTDCD